MKQVIVTEEQCKEYKGKWKDGICILPREFFKKGWEEIAYGSIDPRIDSNKTMDDEKREMRAELHKSGFADCDIRIEVIEGGTGLMGSANGYHGEDIPATFMGRPSKITISLPLTANVKLEGEE